MKGDEVTVNIEDTDSFGNYLIHGIDEIILPDAVSWWPTAPGWKALAIIIVILLLFICVRWMQRWWRNRYRREALRQLQQVQRQAGKQLQEVVAVLPYYLKVTALQAYPRQDVASLSGENWLAFLDKQHSGTVFSKGIGSKLLAVAYLPQAQWRLSEKDSAMLISMSRAWISKHREATDV
jgi:hypothetical protein